MFGTGEAYPPSGRVDVRSTLATLILSVTAAVLCAGAIWLCRLTARAKGEECLDQASFASSLRERRAGRRGPGTGRGLKDETAFFHFGWHS
jgi:hypothetical protein